MTGNLCHPIEQEISPKIKTLAQKKHS